MKYVVLVSHGKMAEGLKNSLNMLAGNKEEVIAVGLEDGSSADEFSQQFEKAIGCIKQEDEIIVLADIIGGSPLTTSLNVLAKTGLIDQSIIFGGMNLPLALTTILMKDTCSLQELKENVLAEAHEALKEFKVVSSDEDDI